MDWKFALIGLLILSGCGLATAENVEGHAIMVSVAKANGTTARPRDVVQVIAVGPMSLFEMPVLYRKAAEQKTGCKVIDDSIKWIGGSGTVMLAEMSCG